MSPIRVLMDPKTETGQRLRRIIDRTPLQTHAEYHATLAGFLAAFTRTGSNRGIAVIQPADRKSLDAIRSANRWPENLRILLVLPDRRPDTISEGFSLFPRFVAFADGCLEHLGRVLANMDAQDLCRGCGRKSRGDEEPASDKDKTGLYCSMLAA